MTADVDIQPVPNGRPAHRSGPHRANIRRFALLLGALSSVAAVSSAGAIAGAAPASNLANAASPSRGGTLTVLEGANYAGAWPEGLDPATDFDAAANSTMMDAIYGGLFQIGNNHRLVYDLATGYKLTDGAKVLTVDLRHGVNFTDGTPFNAAAVVSNWKQDLAGQSPVKPPWPKVNSMTASGPYTVRVQFAAPDGAVINQFQDALVNWIASPTALAKLGAKTFDYAPVGAGPFVVKSDNPGNKLVLARNPHYWQAGHPYLDGLVFQAAANDQTALEDLEAGDGQAYEFMGTPQLVSSFKKAGFTVTTGPGTGASNIKLNTSVAPFNNKLAREAIYYATNAQLIDQKVYDGSCPVTESFTGPGGLFYEQKVPGYRTYDLAKARAIVNRLGGLSFTLYYAAGGSITTVTAATLQTMYEDAGMKVSLKSTTGLPAYVQVYQSGNWQLNPASIGSWDPAGGIGVAFDLQSKAPFSGVHDPKVDALIAKAAATPSQPTRAKYYGQLARYLNQQAYSPFVCSPSSWDIAKRGVQGPGLTSVTPAFSSGLTVLWQDVSMRSS